MIHDSVAWFKQLGREVVYDAEHFFDGWRLDAGYALATLHAAVAAGADCIVLCDTNGGELPDVVSERVHRLRELLDTPLGIHPHNDAGLAVANGLAAVQAGCVQVQGTINGYGERCGNLDLVPLIATLQLKLGYRVLRDESLSRLTEVAHYVAAVADQHPDPHAPYVGHSAFAHKGGIHVAAIAKVPESYQHVDPAAVGNATRVVVSEVAGRRNVSLRAQPAGPRVERRERGAAADQGAGAPRLSVRGGRRFLRDARAPRLRGLSGAVRAGGLHRAGGEARAAMACARRRRSSSG